MPKRSARKRGPGPSAKRQKKFAARIKERNKKTVFGEFGPSGSMSITDSLARSNAVRPRGVDQAARIGIKHRKK